MTATPEQIAMSEGLTKGSRTALMALPSGWFAGPSATNRIINQVTALCEAGLVERKFCDMDQPRKTETSDTISVRLSACWYFRITPLGRAVLAHLKGSPHG